MRAGRKQQGGASASPPQPSTLFLRSAEQAIGNEGSRQQECEMVVTN
jgi:hypothetical protein